MIGQCDQHGFKDAQFAGCGGAAHGNEPEGQFTEADFSHQIRGEVLAQEADFGGGGRARDVGNCSSSCSVAGFIVLRGGLRMSGWWRWQARHGSRRCVHRVPEVPGRTVPG